MLLCMNMMLYHNTPQVTINVGQTDKPYIRQRAVPCDKSSNVWCQYKCKAPGDLGLVFITPDMQEPRRCQFMKEARVKYLLIKNTL